MDEQHTDAATEDVLLKKGVLKISQYLQNILQDFTTFSQNIATSLKRCVPKNITKFFRTPVLKNNCERTTTSEYIIHTLIQLFLIN